MKMPAPEDFAIVAIGKSNTALAQHYGVGTTTINRFRRETGIPGEPSAKFDLPPDFRQRAKVMTMAQLCDHYKVGSGTIQRLCDENGIKTRGMQRTRKPKPPKRPPVPGHSNWGRPAAAPMAVDHSAVGNVVTFLRRKFPSVHRMTVYEATSPQRRNLPGKAEDYYMVGAKVMHKDQLWGLARDMGYEG